MGEPDVRVTNSLLDRLLDFEPGVTREPVPSRADTVQAFRQAVLRDLEHLLNSKNPHHDLPQGFVEASRSVLTYGLVDLSSIGGTTEAHQLRLAQLVEQAIRTFEPRLAGVIVTPVEKAAGSNPSRAAIGAARFRVEGRLLLEPHAEPISFDFDRADADQEWKIRDAG